MIQVVFEYVPVINFSMQQNHVPVVRRLLIKNISETDLEQISIFISTEPDFAIARILNAGCLPKGELLDLGPVDLVLSTRFLSELTEKISGIFTVKVTCGDAVLHDETYKVDVLAYDQWSGISVLPEILSAFITPNHPEIPKIIRRAAAILESWTGSPSFDEYQSRNPDRVKKQMAAVFEAIAERQIIYCTVPASFEDSGQRIRMPDAVFANQLANCLDLSLLYAGCMEAVGINPLVVVMKGHAFAGAWLVGDSFPDGVNDDPSLLTKRMADGINEILLVEATGMNAGQRATFDDAVTLAAGHLRKEDDFVLFADVRRSRFSGIRPLPLRIKTETGWEIVEEQVAERTNDAPSRIKLSRKAEMVDHADVSKQQMWERKLLDLSLRNNLVNLRISGNSVQLICPQLSSLENGLASGTEYQVLPRPADWDNPLRSAGVYQAIHSSDPVIDLVKEELGQKRLRSYLGATELAGSLLNLYRASRLSLEESGANTLYVALGLLRWYETAASERPHFAPVLLLPVEIVRRTTRVGFIIRSREEDAVMNITLLEMLRHDFGIEIGGLGSLPRDESGIDITQVFNLIRQAVMTRSRWDVEEEAFLGIFSFSKFIMWNDIHSNAGTLTGNKVVSSLISGTIKWDVQEQDDSGEKFDRKYHPADIMLPISTDSSQLEAICAASEGRSFVLHGPPGTGKSQTITNIIANALGNGKKVLFVAEKMAALSVVESRLETIGLGPFCLELHSNKAKRSAVLEQLKNTLEVMRTASPQDFALEAERLHSLRTELNNYVDALHKVYPFGFSLYDIFTRYAQVMNAPDGIAFSDRAIGGLERGMITEWDDLMGELQTAGMMCGHLHGHPLEGVGLKQYTQAVKTGAKALLGTYLDGLMRQKSSAAALLEHLNFDIILVSKRQFIQLQIVIDALQALPETPYGLFSPDNLERAIGQLKEIIAHGRKRDEIRDSLLQHYDKNILACNARTLLAEWNMAAGKWFLPRVLKHNTIFRTLTGFVINGDLGKAGVPLLLQELIRYRDEQDVLDKNETMLSGMLGFLWQSSNCDWDQLTFTCEKLVKLNREVSELLQSPGKAKKWRCAVGKEFSAGREAFRSVYGKYFEAYSADYFSLGDIESRLQGLLNVDLNGLPKLAGNRLANCEIHAGRWLEHIERLRDWTSWTQVREKAVSQGLTPVVLAYEQGMVQHNEVIPAYRKGLLRSCADYIFTREQALSAFNGRIFEDKIARFREVSTYFEQLTRDVLFAKLASRVPVASREAAQSSEIGILQRAIRNGGRGMSVRKLFDTIPNLLPRLTPCMLMSPISVAQYLDANTTRFDLVIFDEASQVPTCEAVGAIARGTNVIIVGDPKQMPPTNFFSSLHTDEDNEKEDLESILDDCLALSMPSKYLRWHYRSRHESLIAFSNSRFYENKLLTFPSPDDVAGKVSFVHMDGYYDRSGTRQNRAEAAAIVGEIVRRLADPSLRKQSIGVVTFSAAQQLLIDDMLNDALKADPAIEVAAFDRIEPLFIKNLENVQGDERDVILFSVGYGPGKDGRVSLNFGPVNRSGGWRRLNVAVSRARYEMKVFSTLRADQIDITRTSSDGVAGLKAFLEYAEKGKDALGFRSHEAVRATGLVKLIAALISEKGYEVHTGIGCSGYRIDIGVVDPMAPSRYMLGILCDGHAYSAAKTARDREIVQYEVLKLLGWNIHRAWSPDWWENPERVMEGILNAIERVEAGTAPQVVDWNSVQPVHRLSPQLNKAPVSIVATEPPANAGVVKYIVCHPVQMPASSSADFLLQVNRERVCAQVCDVIRTEAPVSKTLLCRRVLMAWGISRIGTRIADHFEMLFSTLALKKTEEGQLVFFWSDVQDPETYDVYRVPVNDAEKREADDLPPQEVANAVRSILKQQVSLSKDDLVKETAKTFGYARSGNNVELAMLRGLNIAVAKGFVTEDNGRVVLKD